MAYGIIYMITNKANGKKYIGQTIHCFKYRYSSGLYKSASNSHLKNAIKKYGEENFEINECFLTCDSKEELDRMEKALITTFRTFDPKYGYNKTHGGEGGVLTEETKRRLSEAFSGEKNPFYGKTHDEETKKKIANRHYATGDEHYWFGKNLSEETKAKMSKTRIDRGVAKGEKNPFYGKKHSEESIQKMKENNGNPQKGVIGINLLDYEDIVEFVSTKEARRNGFNNVIQNCKGRTDYIKGYKFYYCSDYNTKSKEEITKELNMAKDKFFKKGGNKNGGSNKPT